MASGPKSLSPRGQGKQKQRRLRSLGGCWFHPIPHIARTLVAKPGRRLAPVVIFNSGAVGIVPCASCLLGGLQCPGAKPHQAVTPLARTVQCLLLARTKHHRPSPSHHPSRPPSPLRCRPEALLCSALPCPAAPVSSWTFIIAGKCCVLGTEKMPTGPLPVIMPAYTYSMLCVSDIYMQEGICKVGVLCSI